MYGRDFCSRRNVVDTGCGVGSGSSHLAEVAHIVAGVDKDPRAIQYARRHYNRANTHCLTGIQSTALINTMATLKEEVIETKACRYGTMSFFKNDTTISRSLKEYGEWAQAEIEFLRYLIGSGDTVLDIGAFIGTHTLAFAQKVSDGGKVYAFEPQPICFEVLKKNVEQNALTNVSAFNTAVSDSIARLEICEIDVRDTCNFGGTSILETGSYSSDAALRHTVDVMTVRAS